jgi:hypothetical protein
MSIYVLADGVEHTKGFLEKVVYACHLVNLALRGSPRSAPL